MMHPAINPAVDPAIDPAVHPGRRPCRAPVAGALGLLALALAMALAAGACGSVQVPEEHYYRLVLPQVEPRAQRSPAVLRIEGFELAASLSPDRLLVATAPVQLRAYEFHRWIGPLERLVQDAVREQLTRAGAFTAVKGPEDGPGESLVLTGRIIDFHQVAMAQTWGGKVTVQLRLSRVEDRQVLFHEEFSATVSMPQAAPMDAVQALSMATDGVVRQFLARCDAVAVFAAARPGR
jgi:ABC-type uncharacterized transport system auxiliary subunit